MDKTCDECKSTFTTRTKSPGRERFCGDKCYRKFWNRASHRARHPAHPVVDRLCACCGISFRPDDQHPFAKTCSIKCSQRRVALEIADERAAARDTSPKPCKECGTPFVASKFSWKWRIYCSQKCAVKVASRNYALRHSERVKAAGVRSNRLRWGGNHAAALERDGHQCRSCGAVEHLHVHHRDGSGEGDSPNHDLDNLQTLCTTCHKRVHTIVYRIIDGEVVVSGLVFQLLGVKTVKVST